MPDSWPAELPQCFIRGYTDGEGDGKIATQPDTGPPITRPRTAAVVRPLAGSMRMTRAQVVALDTFYRVTLLSGSLPFEFPDPTFGGTALVMFTNGSQPAWQETAGGVYRVSINLSRMP